MPDKSYTQDKFNGTCDLTLCLSQEETRKWRSMSQEKRKEILTEFSQMIVGGQLPRAPVTLSEARMPVGRDVASRSAAKAAEPKFTGKVKTVYETIRNTGTVGLTDEEGQELLVMSGNSYRPARRSLVKLGLVDKNGEFRDTRAGNNANVWVAIATPADVGV